MKLVNLTPHAVTIVNNGKTTRYPIDGPPARITINRPLLSSINGIPLKGSVLGEVIDLPEPRAGVMYIVSSMVAHHPSVANRQDLIFPGETFKFEGRVSGARVFCAGIGLYDSLISAA